MSSGHKIMGHVPRLSCLGRPISLDNTGIGGQIYPNIFSLNIFGYICLQKFLDIIVYFYDDTIVKKKETFNKKNLIDWISKKNLYSINNYISILQLIGILYNRVTLYLPPKSQIILALWLPKYAKIIWDPRVKK